jgi:hypothetical protein
MRLFCLKCKGEAFSVPENGDDGVYGGPFGPSLVSAQQTLKFAHQPSLSAHQRSD